MAERPTLFQAGRYVVEIDNVVVAAFQDVSGLVVEIAVQEYAEGGNNAFVHRLPGPVKHGTITLKRGLCDSTQFADWWPTHADGKIKVQRKNVSIKVLDRVGATVKQWDVRDAYPVRWTVPDLRAPSMEVAIETIELAHNGWREVK